MFSSLVFSSLGFHGALPVPREHHVPCTTRPQSQDWGGFSPPALKPGALSQIPLEKLFLPQKCS